MDLWNAAKHEKRFIIFLLAVSLFVRVLFFVAFTRQQIAEWLVYDLQQYHEIATQIVSGNGISTNGGELSFYRLPGYPLFLAASYVWSGNSIEAALWAQVIVASLIPLLVWLLSLVFFPGMMRVAKIAALLAALHVGFVSYAGILLSETLFLLLFLLFLVVFFAGRYAQKWLALAGVLLGCASMVRAVGPYLVVIMSLMLLCGTGPMKHKIKNSITFAAAWTLTVLPWLARNFLLTGAVFFHTLPGLHFLQYSATYTVMDCDHCDYFQAKKKLFQQWDERIAQQEKFCGRTLNEQERYSVAEKLAQQWLWAHPLISFKHAVIQIARTCGTLYSSLLLDVPRGTVYPANASLWFKIKLYLQPRVLKNWFVGVIYWELLLSLFIVFGMLLFVLRAWRHVRARRVLFVIAPIMMLVVFLTLAYGCARLRMPIEPFLLIGATYGWLAPRDD